MAEQSQAIANEAEKLSMPQMVPLEKFMALEKKLEKALAELEMLKAQHMDNAEASDADAEVPDERAQMMQLLQGSLGQQLQQELAMTREQMELQGAVKVARQKYAEFQQFEKYILQEVMSLLEKEPEIEKLSWESLVDKGFEQLQKNFKAAVQKNPEQYIVDSPAEVKKAFMEGQAVRKAPPPLPQFTRKQIEKMSLDEFRQNEAAINQALKLNRIR